MKVIIDTINGALQENMDSIVLLIIVTGILYLANIIFGTVLGTKEEGFIGNKFIYGFYKLLLAGLGIFIFCFGLNLFSLTLKLIDINISAQIITILEVLGVLVTWDLDLSKEVYEKIKSLKTLKYVSYDDVQVNPNYTEQDGIG